MRLVKVLCVIDVQNDFIDGSLGTNEAQAVLPNIVEKIKSWKGFTIATMDTHNLDYLSSHEGKKLPVVHCLFNEKGWRMPKSVESALEDGAYLGRCCKSTFGSLNHHSTPSGFAKDLVDKINDTANGFSLEITLIGFCTDICVVSNAIMAKAFLPEVRIIVDSRACAGVTKDLHEAALLVMKSCQIEVR